MIPVYCFVNVSTDEPEEVYFHHLEAPPIGSLIHNDGLWLRRVASPCQISAKVARVTHGYPRMSNALPPTVSGCRIQRDKKSGRKKPVITSQRHEREVRARNNLAEMD